MRQINKHIIHCSDSEFGDVKIFRQWHKQRGFNDVGYHYIIKQDGEIEVGRTLDIVGAHCKGHNKHSIGTCLVGRDKFTKEQFEALRRLDTMLKAMFKGMTTHPHNEFSPKTCPNFDVKRVLEND